MTRPITIHKGSIENNISGTILKVGNNEPNRLYLIDKEKKVGSGKTCDVYRASTYPTPDNPTPFIVKIFKPGFFQKQKYEIEAQYRENIDTCLVEEIYYSISPYLEGESLDKHLKQSSRFSTFDLLKRLKIAGDLLTKVKEMHGDNVLHMDLKPQNIILNIDPKKNQHTIHIIDYGNSHILENNNPSHKIEVESSGSPGYIAPEVLKEKKAGFKSDIYSLTPILMSILGATNPMKEKNEARKKSDKANLLEKEEAIANIAFNSENLMSKFPPITTLYETKKLVIDFFARMQNENYDKRPDINEVCRFFATLYKLVDENKKNIEQKIAELFLITYGSSALIPEDFFQREIRFDRLLIAIKALQENKLLDKELIEKITKKENLDLSIFLNGVATLNEHGLLSRKNFDIIFHNEEFFLILNQMKNNRWKIDGNFIRETLLLSNFFCLLNLICKHTTKDFLEAAIKNINFLTALGHEKETSHQINKPCIFSIWIAQNPKDTQFLAQLSTHELTDTIKYLEKKGDDHNLVLELKEKQFINDFIVEYTKTYQNTFFKNPRSKMWLKIKHKENLSYEAIKQHQELNPGSRTDKVIKKYLNNRVLIHNQ